MESQSGCHPNEDMKMSYAPSFRAPGGHIFDVVAQGLENMYLQRRHACTACSIGTTYEFGNLKVSD
jgi:hypothetical protein